MRQADRLATVLDELSADGSVSVSELSDRFGVSVATVRRDLQLLEEQRLVARVHGGAVARGVLYELPLRYKVARNQEEKRRIATRGRRARRRRGDRRVHRRHDLDRGRPGGEREGRA